MHDLIESGPRKCPFAADSYIETDDYCPSPDREWADWSSICEHLTRVHGLDLDTISEMLGMRVRGVKFDRPAANLSVCPMEECDTSFLPLEEEEGLRYHLSIDHKLTKSQVMIELKKPRRQDGSRDRLYRLKPIPCPVSGCDSLAFERVHVQRHLRDFHGWTNEAALEPPLYRPGIPLDVYQRFTLKQVWAYLSCSQVGCSDAFTTIKQGWDHLVVKHGFTEEDSKLEQFNPRDESAILDGFHCPITSCGKYLTVKQSMQLHLQKFHGIAREKLDSEYQLRRTHGPDGPPVEKERSEAFHCPLEDCKKPFTRKDGVTAHLRKFHKLSVEQARILSLPLTPGLKGPPPVEKDRSNDFHCPMEGCDRPFTQKSAVKTHLRAVHKLTAELIRKISP
jgi:hypothetical protein